MKQKGGSLRTHYNTISVSNDHGLVNVEMSQPPSNRMTSLFFNELSGLIKELKDLDELSAIVISGKGRHFSSGADLDELMDLVVKTGKDTAVEESFFDKNYLSFLFFEELKVPVITAIRGVCLGAAMELALFSHFRFCGEDAVMGLPECDYNLMPGIGGTSRFIRLAGTAKGLELVLRGSTFPAEEALKHGLVDRVVPRRQVVPFALDFARKISQGYRKEKRVLYLNSVA